MKNRHDTLQNLKLCGEPEEYSESENKDAKSLDKIVALPPIRAHFIFAFLEPSEIS